MCGAGYGKRVNSRNGYRQRDWDTRAGTVELAIPKLRPGSYFPDWLLQHRRRAEQSGVPALPDRACLSGIRLVVSDGGREVLGLVNAIGPALPCPAPAGNAAAPTTCAT